MASINLINQRILEMEGGQFQKLCNAYLYQLKGYKGLNSLGSTAESYKTTKGTPDSFFIDDNGKLIFVEETTQQTGLLKKICGDIEKCFDEAKTRVPLGMVSEILVCYTGKLEPSEVITLLQVGKDKKVKISLYSLDQIAQDLYKSPYILRNFLNIQEDTNQIIPIDKFPQEYSRARYSLPLDTEFLFRDTEVGELTDYLQTENLVLIAGKPGVGKSRLGLEVCKRFVEKNTDFLGYGIISVSQPIFDDLRNTFISPGKYIILVDDANRISRFSYFMDFLRRKPDELEIKLVVTVRDYALDQILGEISSYPFKKSEITEFSEENISEFLKRDFLITNPWYIERICDLSDGNPRIAVMLSKIVLANNDLSSINDVSMLYDEYFRTIITDSPLTSNSDILKTASIISFFRSIDFQNNKLMEEIRNIFSIDPQKFYEYSIQLSKYEIVDLYKNDIVKISDQVLSTYIFYLAIFKEKITPLNIYTQNFFPSYANRIRDAYYAVLSAFNRDSIIEETKPELEKIWVEHHGDESYLLKLASIFFFLLQDKVLLLVKKRTKRIKYEDFDFLQLKDLEKNRINNIQLPEEFIVLSNFRYSQIEIQKIAIDLIFTYLERCPNLFIEVLNVLTNSFGFSRYSLRYGIQLQQEIIDKLGNLTKGGENYLFSRLFIEAAKYYIKIHFNAFESKSDNGIVIFNFNITLNEETTNFRKTLFKILGSLYPKFPGEILNVFREYIGSYDSEIPKEIIIFDKDLMVQFIATKFSDRDLQQCIFVNRYLEFLHELGIEYPQSIQDRFLSDSIKIYNLLIMRLTRRHPYEKVKKDQRTKILSFLKNKNKEEILKFIDLTIGIKEAIKEDHLQYELSSGFALSLVLLSEIDINLFTDVLVYYYCLGDPLQVNSFEIINILLKRFGKKYTLTICEKFDIFQRNKWKFLVYQVLPDELILEDDTNKLEQLFNDINSEELPYHLDFLLHYIKFDNRLIEKVSRSILTKRVTTNSICAISSIINPFSEINKEITAYFNSDFALLEKLYLFSKDNSEHNDHDSTTLVKIISVSPNFIDKYVEWLIEKNEKTYYCIKDNQDYTRIWSMQNYEEIFVRIIKKLYENVLNGRTHYCLKNFFGSEYFIDQTKRVTEKEQVLRNLIQKENRDNNFVNFLFYAVNVLPFESRLKLIKSFLVVNNKFDDFKNIYITFMPGSWSGSQVPIIQKQIDCFEKILSFLDSIEFIEHRAYISECIENLQKSKNRAMMEDWSEA